MLRCWSSPGPAMLHRQTRLHALEDAGNWLGREAASTQELGNKRMVGWLEGIEGLCLLFLAIPFGTLADRWRRDRVLRIASFIELGAVPLLAHAIASLCRSGSAGASTISACADTWGSGWCSGQAWQACVIPACAR